MDAELLDVEQSIQPLSVDVAPGRLSTNLDEFTARCRELAEDYRELAPIDDGDGYRQAKRNRAAINRCIKEANSDRVRVKTTFMEPYEEFNDAVTDALAPLQEAATRQDGLIKDYERRLLNEKRQRLEGYWETTYPKLALCCGDADEPLVPFSRVYDPDWCKRISEANRDEKPIKRMDEIATKLSDGRDLILEMREPDDVKADAMSRMYRTLDPVRAIGDAREEARRRADIDRIDQSIDGRDVHGAQDASQGLQEAREAAAEGPVDDYGEEGGNGPQEASGGPTEGFRYVVTIPCATFEEKERVVEVMRANGIRGTVRKEQA